LLLGWWKRSVDFGQFWDKIWEGGGQDVFHLYNAFKNDGEHSKILVIIHLSVHFCTLDIHQLIGS